jgi:restriction system protein
MSPRRSGGEQLLDELYGVLRHSQWWAGPIFIAMAWAFLRFVFPWVMSSVEDPSQPVKIGGVLVTLSKGLAPWAAGFVAVVWVVALAAKLRDSRRLDRQSGLESIRALPWHEFEHLLAEAFRRQGYEARVSPRGADGGIDIVLTGKGDTVLVQCKHWKKQQVGVKPIRELMGVVASEGAALGILVASGTFTTEARRFAEGNPIRLIDGQELERLIADVGRGRLGQPVDARAPVVTGDAEVNCPKCGSTMVKRVAKRGPGAGQEFWGCTEYPRCRGTRRA